MYNRTLDVNGRRTDSFRRSRQNARANIYVRAYYYDESPCQIALVRRHDESKTFGTIAPGFGQLKRLLFLHLLF